MSVVDIRNYRLSNEESNWEECRENLRHYCRDLLLRIDNGEVIAMLGIEVGVAGHTLSTHELNLDELEVHHMIGILEIAKDRLKENLSG